jgi:hypothetical protein
MRQEVSMTRTIRSLFTVLFASSLVLVATPIANATPHRALPAAQVHIARKSSIGVNSSAVVHIWQRCTNGVVVAETVVEVTQPGAGGVSAGDFGMMCDGHWHRVDVTVSSTTAPFAPGLADVDARFTVLDPDSFDPLPQGVDSRQVWVAAPAQVRVFGRGVLDEAGNASVAVWARCQAPWTVALLSVELTQGDDAGQGHSNDFGLACDGRWFRRVLKVVPSPGSFEPGASEANASLSILDPNTGDPVYTARFERNVWLVGSVAPVLWDQTGARDGAIVSADASDDTLDAQGADDFVVPAGAVWSITSVFAPGSNGATHAPPFLVPGVNVFIYEDGGDQPGASITSYVDVPPTTAPDDLTIPLSPAVTLQPGTYWISVQADVSSLGPGNGWLWAFRQDPTGATGVWRNPGGGFGGGSEDWTPLQGTAGDFEFDLRGTSASA